MVIVIDGQQYQIVSYYGASYYHREIIGDIYYLVIKQHQYRIEFKIKTGLTLYIRCTGKWYYVA